MAFLPASLGRILNYVEQYSPYVAGDGYDFHHDDHAGGGDDGDDCDDSDDGDYGRNLLLSPGSAFLTRNIIGSVCQKVKRGEEQENAPSHFPSLTKDGY